MMPPQEPPLDVLERWTEDIKGKAGTAQLPPRLQIRITDTKENSNA